jgi:hypothetical protein
VQPEARGFFEQTLAGQPFHPSPLAGAKSTAIPAHVRTGNSANLLGNQGVQKNLGNLLEVAPTC